MSAIPVIPDVEIPYGLLGLAAISLPVISFPLILRPAKRFSDDELLRFCSDNSSLRIERTADGDLILMTPAGTKNANREGYLFREIDLWAERSGGVTLSANSGVSFPDGTLRLPDAGWIREERWLGLTEKEKEGFLPICPDFVVELRSPGDRISQVEAKMEFWMSRGALLGWLIDPERKLAMIYRLHREPETVLNPEFLDGDGPIAGFRLKMQRFWE